MSKKSETLKAEPRTKLGSRAARALRAQGRIPASINGDAKNQHADFSISADEFLATRRRHTHLYDLDAGGTMHTAVVRELHWDTFGESLLHVEFKRVQRDVKTESEVRLEFVGHPKGGVLNHLVNEVTVSCVPLLIPDMIEVSVAGLDIGGTIFGRDLVAPEGVEILVEPGQRIAVVVEARVEVAEPETPAEAEEGAAAPAAPAEAAKPAKDKAKDED